MIPILFRFGPITVYSFGFFLALAFFAAAFILWREGKRQGYTEERLLDLSIISLVAAILGSRAHYALLNWNLFREEPMRIFFFWEGGLSYQGALVGVLISVAYFARKWKWPFFQIADIAALAATATLVIGKIGAFMAGIDFGKTSDLPWAVTFPNLIGPRHPAQLYEAAAFFLLFIFLYYFYFRNLASQNMKSGKIFFYFLISSSIIGIFSLFFRADSNLLLGISIKLWLNTIIAAISLVALYYFQVRNLREDIKNFLSGILRLNTTVLRKLRL